MCLLGLLAAFFPRLGVLLIWLARPALFSAAIGPVFAILGIIFLPFTTLMYVLLWSPAGFGGWDLLWLGLAFLIDIGGALGSGAGWYRRPRAAVDYQGL